VYATALPLDLAAFLPVIAGGVAFGLMGRQETDAPTPAATAAVATPATAEAPALPPGPDPEQLLKAAGQLKGAPLFQEGAAAKPAARSDSPLDRVWRAAGG